MLSCAHNSTISEEILARVPDSQGGSGRHRCIICAYARGVSASRGAENIASLGDIETCRHGAQAVSLILSKLPESQAGAGRHKCATCAFQFGFQDGVKLIERQVEADVQTEKATHGSDSEPGDVEGREVLRISRVYERSPRNRRLAIQAHGTVCFACGFDFNKFYGAEHARSYIEIHHLNPLARRGEGVIDPVAELRPLCANCHSMAHRNPDHVLEIGDLRNLIHAARIR